MTRRTEDGLSLILHATTKKNRLERGLRIHLDITGLFEIRSIKQPGLNVSLNSDFLTPMTALIGGRL